MFESIGGRKFVGLIIIAATGAAVQVFSPNGLGMELAGLLVGLYTSFAASNAVITNKALDKEPEQPANSEDVAKAAEQVGVVIANLQDSYTRQESQLSTIMDTLRVQQNALTALLNIKKP